MLALEIGYTPQYIGRVLSGRYPSSPQFRAAIASALNEPEPMLFHDVAPNEAVAS